MTPRSLASALHRLYVLCVFVACLAQAESLACLLLFSIPTVCAALATRYRPHLLENSATQTLGDLGNELGAQTERFLQFRATSAMVRQGTVMGRLAFRCDALVAACAAS